MAFAVNQSCREARVVFHRLSVLVQMQVTTSAGDMGAPLVPKLGSEAREIYDTVEFSLPKG